MEIYVFISLGIISSWLIWVSILLFVTLKKDTSFIMVIFNRKQLLKYWLFIAAIIAISFYLLFIRMQNIGKVINVYEICGLFVEIVSFLSWTTLIIFGIVIIVGLICVFLALRLLYKNIQLRLLALYLYYYQYEFFWSGLVGRQVDLRIAFNGYVVRRVMIFTQKDFHVIIARIIWPRSFYWFEPRICKIIIPYLVIFDILTQDGFISKVFYVIPWYYIYMLLRTTWFTFQDFYTPKNTEFSEAVYKKFIINGEIHRMAIIPNTKDN